MPTASQDDEVLRALGGAAEAIDKNLADFTAAARVLSSDQPRLIDQYPKEWVAVYHGGVVAHGAAIVPVCFTVCPDVRGYTSPDAACYPVGRPGRD
jgi:hypothetical protein